MFTEAEIAILRSTTYVEWSLSGDKGSIVGAISQLALAVNGIYLAGEGQFGQIEEGIDVATLLTIQTGELIAANLLDQIVVGTARPMDLSGSRSFRHDKSVRIAAVLLSVVHYSQTVSDFVSNHEARFKTRGFIDGAAVVTFAHSAHPSQAQHAGVIFGWSVFVQVEPDGSVCECDEPGELWKTE